jgi:hypothetical protein
MTYNCNSNFLILKIIVLIHLLQCKKLFLIFFSVGFCLSFVYLYVFCFFFKPRALVTFVVR